MKFRMLIILDFFTLTAVAQANIDSCQEKAKANYPLIQQYDLITKSTEYTLANASKAYLPQVSLTAIGGYIIQGLPAMSIPGQPAEQPSKVQMIGIAQVNQVIWDGGATKTQKEIAKAGAGVEKSNIDVSLFAIRERVNQIYFGILVIDEQMKQLDILNDNLNRNLEKARLSKENGLAYQSDVDEVKAEILNLEQKKIEFIYTRQGYVHMLSLLTGEKMDEYIKLEKPVFVQSVETLINNRPEIVLYENQLKLIEAQSAINKVSLLPKIGLMGLGLFIGPGIYFGTSKVNSLAITGINMSWKIEGLYKNMNNKSLDFVKAEKVKNQKETFLFNNNLQLTQTSSEIEKQKAIIVNDEEIVKLKAEITKSYQTRYNNGMCTMNDLINATNRESEAKVNQALHSVQLLMSYYNYKTTSGN